MFLTIALSTCAVLVVFLLWNKPRKNGGSKLPGPLGLPLLGNLLQIGYQPHLTFAKWAKRYGPIYGIKMGLIDTVIVNDHKLIKELFNEPASTGRISDNAVMMEFSHGPYGIINSSGSTWEAQRKFTVKTLRSLGFAKASMENIILDEAQAMLEWFRKRENKAISGLRIFHPPVITALWRLVLGERCNWEETRPVIFDELDEFFKVAMVVSSNGLLLAPFLRHIAPNLMGWNRFAGCINTLMNLFQKSINKHKETFDSTELRDFIDHHLFEISKETGQNSSFHGEAGDANMLAGVFDLFFAGSETTSMSLSWTLLYLSQHQEIQKQLQKEIDNIVGSRLPSISDRVNMPYSEAVISEIMRISSVTPVGNIHEMRSDLIFHGYHLPKRAYVFPNLYGVHHDPEIWGDPETFRPERFLNEDGTKILPHDAVIPFSDGKRKCIGETFARDTFFLFLTTIFQQFSILPDQESKEKADFEGDVGLLRGPKPFKVVVSSRKN